MAQGFGGKFAELDGISVRSTSTEMGIITNPKANARLLTDHGIPRDRDVQDFKISGGIKGEKSITKIMSRDDLGTTANIRSLSNIGKGLGNHEDIEFQETVYVQEFPKIGLDRGGAILAQGSGEKMPPKGSYVKMLAQRES